MMDLLSGLTRLIEVRLSLSVAASAVEAIGLLDSLFPFFS